MNQPQAIREGLFTDGASPELLGSRCRETGELFYPAQAMNPVTHRPGTMEPALLGRTGTLLNFGVVSRAAPGFSSPYAMGIIALDSGPVLTTQLEHWQASALQTGMAVELVVGTICTRPDGLPVVGPKFQPVRGATS